MDNKDTVKCSMCGQCCRTQPIPVNLLDIETISSHLEIDTAKFTEKYLKLITTIEDEKTYIFKEKPCPFLKGNICTIHGFKPTTCRTTPCMKSTKNREFAQKYGFLTLQFLENTEDDMITHLLSTEYTGTYLEKNKTYRIQEAKKYTERIRKDLENPTLRKKLLKNIIALGTHPDFRAKLLEKILKKPQL